MMTLKYFYLNNKQLLVNNNVIKMPIINTITNFMINLIKITI